jgi:hypothetical protein
MVNIISDSDNHALLFLSKGKYCTFDLGKVPLQIAEQVKRYIEVLVASKASGTEPDNGTARWLFGLDDVPYAQLVDASLVAARPSMESVFDGFMDMLTTGLTTRRKPSRAKRKSAATGK